MKASASVVLLLCALLCTLHIALSVDAEESKPLLGRPDGHELGGEDAEHPPIGRPDGHEPGVSAAPTPQPPLGRPDGHERPAASEDDEDPVDDYIYDDDKAPVGDSSDSEGQDADLDIDFSPFKDDPDDPYYTDYDGDSSEVPTEFDNGDSEKPLVRCKRPICDDIVCPEGYESDANGCPTCRCRETSVNTSKPLIGRPDGHEPGQQVDCSRRPMCRMFCANGFATGEDGCPVCSCLRDPCMTMECDAGTICVAQPCEDRHSCTQLTAKCVPAGSLPCPEPMCANWCPGGYKRSTQGCMTCDCVEVPKERQCGEKVCEEGMVCRNKTVDSTTHLTCTLKTLCEIKREHKPLGLGDMNLECEADGSFKPLQCNTQAADCWCVDGLGNEIDGTRNVVYIEEHKPKCVRNITVSMHIHMTLVVRHDVDVDFDQLSSLNATIVDHVSTWMLIEPHYIRVLKAKTSDDEDSEDENTENSDESAGVNVDLDDDLDNEEADLDDEEDEDGPRLVVVELVVFHDGISDLPSAADYMRRRMHQGMCHIPVGGSFLDPDVDKLQTEHKFMHQPAPLPVMYDDHHQPKPFMRYGICTVAGLFVLLVTSAIIMGLMHRHHRFHVLQFRHRKLDAQTSVSSEKNLLAAENEYTTSPVVSVDKEKEPIA